MHRVYHLDQLTDHQSCHFHMYNKQDKLCATGHPVSHFTAHTFLAVSPLKLQSQIKDLQIRHTSVVAQPFSSAHISPSTSQTSPSKSFLKVRREKEPENYQKSTKDLNYTTVHFVHPVITDHVSTVVMLGINIEGPAVK